MLVSLVRRQAEYLELPKEVRNHTLGYIQVPSLHINAQEHMNWMVRSPDNGENDLKENLHIKVYLPC